MALPDPMARLQALRRVPMLRRLTKEALFEVGRRTREIAYPAGSAMVTEGDPGDALFIIVAGRVEVRRQGRVVSHMAEGDFFGEISLLDGEPRSATVVAADDVVVLILQSADFEDLLRIPHVARSVLRSLATRIREGPDAGPT